MRGFDLGALVLRIRDRRPVWRVASYTVRDRTMVSLQLVRRSGAVVDEHVVASVPGDAYDRLRHLLQAQLEAESRAMRLNKRPIVSSGWKHRYQMTRPVGSPRSRSHPTIRPAGSNGSTAAT